MISWINDLILAPKAVWSTTVVDGPVVALKRSPFFKDVLIIAGGWMFQIWKEKVHVCIFNYNWQQKGQVFQSKWKTNQFDVFEKYE